jgi:SAM-dependent methyltransferase
MPNFTQSYSRYYNLLYRDKNYAEEFYYIAEFIPVGGGGVMGGKSVLDIGCGTGKHLLYFKEAGYTVCGIDSSEGMLYEARKYLGQDAELVCARASEFDLNRKFDVITALFHVIDYQTTNADLEKVFLNIAKHLTAHGCFLFDFWYGPAVLTDPPVVRIKRLWDKEIYIIRIAEPEIHYTENIVDVHFEVMLENKCSGTFEKLHEIHSMRYLFLPEIRSLAEKAGLRIVNTYEWLTKKPLSNKSWYGFVILEKL